MTKLLLIVVLMALVTYLPRMLPMVLLGDVKMPLFLNTFLQFVPYAVLGALIFPAVLSSTGDTASSTAGALAAVLLSLLRLNIMLVVLGGIAGAFMWGMFF